jgi:hypothetical protein
MKLVPCFAILIHNFCFRTWQLRKILVSKDMLYVSRTSENVPIDTIPLHEIISVTGMSDDHRRESTMSSERVSSLHFGKRSNTTNPTSSDSNKHEMGMSENHSRATRLASEDFQFVREHYDKVFQIKTDQDGFNSGRTYYLQTNSKVERQDIIEELDHIVEKAKSKKAASSMLHGMQHKIRKIYNSYSFQMMVAFLIITVPYPFKSRSSILLQDVTQCHQVPQHCAR